MQNTRRIKATWFILIVVLATTAGMFCAWRAPALNSYAQDWLMRSRGVLPEPDDIVIVAIDEPSIAKLGHFPWSREYTARVVNTLSAAQPKVIALDILYIEPTDEIADSALSDAIKKAGNVVVGEQLIEEQRETSDLSRSVWLRSLSAIETSAAGIGHVNVEAKQDGAARELLLRLADDDGDSRWALALETVRVGDGLNPNEVNETNRFVRIGTRKIPFNPVERNLFINVKDADSRLTTVQPLRMTIDYIGPSGAFAGQTYSFADVLENRVAPEKFRGKYVLIGATAATLGDRIATPFVGVEDADGDQHGDLMPGVEILANEINTILRNRFYQPISDSAAALCAALTALAVLILLGFAQGKYEALKQIGVLVGLLALILLGSYLTFVHALFIPPLVPVLASFAVATPLALLRRQIAASVNLDERITELLAAENRLFTNGRKQSSPQLNNQYFEATEDYDSQIHLTADKFYLPRGLEWKSQTLGVLSRDLIARALFIDRAMRSIEDGLLIADCDGQITFANQSAARIFNLPERKLLGSDIFECLAEAENQSAIRNPQSAIEPLARLLIDRDTIEREIIVGKTDSRYFVLRLSAVAGRDEGNETLGIIATLSDITQHRQLQKTKNDVIALVTHELRTPLTAIQGMSEVLTEHEVEAEPQRKMLLTINTEAKRLANMINEYLDITRLESGAQKANFTSVNVESLIERTLLLLEPLAAKRGIKIVCSSVSNQTTISADTELLAQALTNIVANAIKYSPKETTITVQTRLIDEMLQICVADEGYGISAEQLPRIFEKFYRVPRRQNAEVSGTGLGLALAQQIAELHGGRITAASEPNKGSIFTIYLPLAPDV